ncbi:MAG TPA: DUF4105 domain-containing protein [Kofleriaceae bacterium]|jgi:hypothetical protein
MSARLVAVLAIVLGLSSIAIAQPSVTPVHPPPSAEQQKLMDEYPIVTLVTMGTGALIWERHGHIAICVQYNETTETCFNYGVGDFAHPLKMAWGFFRANGAFYVDDETPGRMLYIYKHTDRTIWAQRLPLTQEQKAKVIKKLEADAAIHLHYSYDHFWDNCTTRVRDILDDATDHEFKKMPNKTDGRSFRQLAREGFFGTKPSWLPLLITDIAMGRVTDQVPSYWDRMFLPDYLREAVIDLWGVQPVVINQRKGPFAVKEIEKTLADGTTDARAKELRAQLDALHNETSGRVQFALLVLLLTSPAWLTRLWGRLQRTGLAFAVIPTVLFGLVFWGLSLVSVLPYVRWNETCLCLMPFDLALLVLSGDKKKSYAKFRVGMLALVAALLLINVLKQPIWPVWLWALVPNLVVAFMPMQRGARASAGSASATSPT